MNKNDKLIVTITVAIVSVVMVLGIGFGIFAFYSCFHAEPEGPYEPVEPPYSIDNDSYVFEVEPIDDEIELYQVFDIIKDELELRAFKEKYNIEEDTYELEKDLGRYNAAVIYMEIDSCAVDYEFNDVISNKDGTYTIKATEYHRCGVCAPLYTMQLVLIPKEAEDVHSIDVDYKEVRTQHCDPMIAYKPIIYLYPTEDINLHIEFNNQLTVSYPKYNNGWDISVKKDGSIYDNNGKYYYGLYFEENDDYKPDFSEGFYVNKDNAINFLEDKLTTLGLNDKEKNEFIMFWLPILEKNKDNLVYFETTDSLNSRDKINLSIEPDTYLRIRMFVKKVDGKIDIKEQILNSTERNGFTLVEWGGVILD